MSKHIRVHHRGLNERRKNAALKVLHATGQVVRTLSAAKKIMKALNKGPSNDAP